jgi:peptidyl-prolyl cis-trans isomerase SurA
LITLDAIHSPFEGPFLVDEVHLAQIVINITPLVSDAKAHATILSITHDAINHKDSFETLAKRTSEDPASAPKGGDLGWLVVDKLPPELQIGIEQVQDGHLSDPIRSANSWSVVKVIKRRKEDQQELHQQYLASQILFEKKALAALQAWQAQIRSESYVQILDPSLRIESLK